MNTVICSMSDCVHRSSRPLRKWKYRNGEPCYSCKLDSIGISEIHDPDGDCEATIGKENMAHCADYEPKEGTV